MAPPNQSRSNRQAMHVWRIGSIYAAVICLSYQVACIQASTLIQAQVRSTKFTPPIGTITQEITPSDQKIDFALDILPILRKHCFSCHDANRTEGDLQLDNETFARRGGHTGLPLFATTLTESELYQRIIADDPGYRMPKRAAPLTETEIKQIGLWIEQGASYDQTQAKSHGFVQKGDNPSSSSGSYPTNQLESDKDQSLFSYDQLGKIWLASQTELSRPRYQYGVWVLCAWCGWIFLLLFRLRYSNRWVTWKQLLLLFPLLAMGSLVLYQQGLILELKNTTLATSTIAKRQSAPPISFDRKNLTRPTHPMHPPRLGGIYYRGNDERDPQLFNQGFYRTATLEVWLVDQNDQIMNWNDDVSDRALTIKVLIRRSPGTTPQLFTKRIMEMTYLRRFRETELADREAVSESGAVDESARVDLSVLEPDQAWEARIPLEPQAIWDQQKLAGVVYLFYGHEMIDGQQGRVHFGIRYDLHLQEGKISPQSELWMGSMYDLGGRVLIPQEGEVLLDRWFDFRPIPEIEGQNPDDSKLLGLPEHYQ